METREFEIRLSQEEERTIEGVAVPFGQTISVGGIQERFAKGAIESVDGVLLFWRHEEPIGLVTAGTETDEGYVIKAHISDTPRGNEAYTLLKDGVINRMSVGFLPVTDSLDDGVVVREKVNLKEVSLVPFPAYSQAKVLAVRENDEPTTDLERNETTMETNTNEIAELRSLVEDLDRRMVVAVDTAPAHAVPQFRSYGEFIKAVASNDDAAVEMVRLYTGGVLADSIVKDAWVSDVIRLVDAGRPTINAFRRAGLPAEGMNVEWPQIAANTMEVDVQSAEGDTLHYGEISLETKTSAVHTYGGYTSMSRQVIERSSAPYLDTAFRAMALAYAKKTNAAAITALSATTASIGVNGSASGWYGGIADAALALSGDFGISPEFILCAGDVYKKIAVLFDSNDRPIVGGNFNGVGSSNVAALTASIGGLPVYVDAALGNGTCYISNREAFVTYESAGAPFRLADEDITALTKDFSVYGYAAFALPMPDAVIKVTVA